MKRLAVFIALSAVLFTACSKKKYSNVGYSVQPGKGKDTLVALSATIDGEKWVADSVHGYKIKYATDSGRFDLLVSATRNNNGVASTVTFTVTDYKGIGTYLIAPPMVSATYYKANSRKFASSGQVIVDSDTEYGIIGSFNFAYDTSLSVTDGVFNVAQP